jgi:hypothetical protein
MANDNSGVYTIWWAGSYTRAAYDRTIPPSTLWRVSSGTVITYWFSISKAAHSNVRQALIKHFGEPGRQGPNEFFYQADFALKEKTYDSTSGAAPTGLLMDLSDRSAKCRWLLSRAFLMRVSSEGASS